MRSNYACILLGLSLPLLGLPTAANAEVEIISRLDSFSYSEPVTIKATFNNLGGDYTPGENAFTHDQIELGLRYGNWSLAWLARYDYYLEFHADTAELLHSEANDLPLQLGRRYRIDLDVNHLKATGLKLAYGFNPTTSLQGQAAISYLKTEEVLDGNISGSLTTLADGSIETESRVDYVYYEDKLLDRQVDSVSGEGIALDLRLEWRPLEALILGVDAQDLYTEIRWDDAPFTTARVTSSVVSLTPEGLLDTQPVLSGTEGFSNHRQRLPARTTSWADWQWGSSERSGVELFAVDSLIFPRLTHQQAISENSYLRALWDFKADALGVAYAHQNFQLSLISDSLDLSDAHTFGLALGVNIGL